MYIPIVAMLFGIINSVIINLAKAMQRHGIETFDQIRAKVKKEGDFEAVKGTKKPTIYIIGFALNQTPMLWAMLSNMFSEGNSSYYTSMFGIGLIVLMLYSAKILKEEIKKIEYIGSFILILGTIILGWENSQRPEFKGDPNLVALLVLIVIMVGLGVTGVFITHKLNKPLYVGIVFGLFVGYIGALDPILKGIGQSYQVEDTGFLPDFSNPIATILFLASFIFATTAFLTSQWGFAKKADASVLVPCISCMQVAFPILLYTVTYRTEYQVTWITMLGLAITIIGIVLMQIFKEKN
ncbi:MAG: hypothetical protein GF364_10855 [Candidatus Lokiarchaeota archaeon]|nr:hypothetical protein [Candidatus Lokiarchaeota archaeon]